MSPMGEQTLEPVNQDRPPACKPKYRRLNSADLAYALKLSDSGVTQVEIAKRLGCTQQTVSEWLIQCQDTTAAASLYLRGQALPMAQKVVRKGKPSDLIKALQGVNVLQAEVAHGGITVIVGSGSQVQINLGVPSTPQPVVLDASLTKSE